MSQPAAIAATFSDWRTVKSRKQLQLIFEVPLEDQAKVLDFLGAPLPDNPKWVGIALLVDEPARPNAAMREGIALHKQMTSKGGGATSATDQEAALDDAPVAEHRAGNGGAPPREAPHKTAAAVREEQDYRTREAPQRCPTAAPMDSGARAVQQAGILCADQQFQEWLWRDRGEDYADGPGGMSPLEWERWTSSMVRHLCGVISRREFARDEMARAKFHAIEVSFAQATGRMAKDIRA